MTDVTQTLRQRQKEIEEVLAEIDERMPPPVEGALRITHSNGKPRFYQCTESGRRYLKKSESIIAESLANRAYLSDLRDLYVEENESLDRFLACYRQPDSFKLLHSLNPERQKLVIPFDRTDEEFAAAWKSTMRRRYKLAVNSYDVGDRLTAQDNTKVRSKSELFLANLFIQFKIPYFYELPLQLGNRVVFPDFTLLNVRKRKTYYWEHLGMLGDEDYAAAAVNKLLQYEQNNLYENVDLLLSFESGSAPISTAAAEKKIKRFLL